MIKGAQVRSMDENQSVMEMLRSTKYSQCRHEDTIEYHQS